ncbi:MAG: hypothetical protein FJ098_17220, partial [Deltaproteobacteria bacterium]|nr:hypothetical protein [Deltaproteobacteria bacterium]
TSVLELFEGHFDCEAMVAGVQDSTLTCLNRPRSALVEDCEAAVSAALGPYLALAAMLAGEQSLEVDGLATLIDGNQDLQAEALEGTLEGAWVLEGSEQGPVSIPFSSPVP